MNSQSEVKYGALISYCTIGFYIIAGFFYTPYLIRKLGLSDFGLFSLSLSIIGYFSMDFGVGAALTRFIARFRAEKREDEIQNILGITTKLYLAMDFFIVLILCVLYIYSDKIFTSLSPSEYERFRLILLITSTFIIFSFPMMPLNGIFIAYEKMIILQSIEFLSKLLSVTFLVVALWIGYGLFGVVIISSAITLIFQVIKTLYLRFKLGLCVNIRFHNREMLKSIASFSLWATIATIADKFFFAVIPIFLAALSGTAEVAVFAIIATIEGYILTIARAMNGLFLPKVMKMVVDNNNSSQITNLMIRVGRVQLYIIGYIIICLFVFGQEFFKLWVGDDFDMAYYGMIIVLLPCLFHLTMGVAEELIYARNKVKYRAIIYVTGSILSVGLIIALAPKLGAIGASIGVGVAFLIAYNILADIIYQKVLNLEVVLFFKKCHLRILPFILIIITLGGIIQILVPTNTYTGLITKGIFLTIIYILIIWFFSINQEEKDLIMSFFRHKNK